MPGGGRTGPMGMGPMTGRGAGYCAGHGMPGYANPSAGYGPGMGRGRGRGMAVRCGGRGRRNMFYATGLPGWARYGAAPVYPSRFPAPDPESEKEMLAEKAEFLRSELEAVKKRMDEIESRAGKDEAP